MQVLVAHVCAPILAIDSGKHLQIGLDDGELLLYSASGCDSPAVRVNRRLLEHATCVDATHDIRQNLPKYLRYICPSSACNIYIEI